MTLTDAQLQEIRERIERAEQHSFISSTIEHQDRALLLSAFTESRERERRAVEALRKRTIWRHTATAVLGCHTCGREWVAEALAESHNSVRLSGDTEPGPCPAELLGET